MNIIGIAGPARSGKDTLALNLKEVLEGMGVKCEITSFAKQLREECDEFLMKTLGISAFTQEQSEKDIIRPLLVTWGTHVRRKLDPDVWVKAVAKHLKDDCVTIVSDVRFDNELQWIHDNGGCSIFVDRYLPNGNLVPPANADEAEHTIPLRSEVCHSFVWDTISNEQWLVAIAFEVLNKAVPEEVQNKWIQTCPL